MKKWTRVTYYPSIPLSEDGRRVTGSREHILLSKEAAKEGMVLLKNQNDLLPLKKGSRLALFGKGTFDYIKGGGGSGDVTVSYIRNLYDGFLLKKDKVTVFEELCDYYKKEVERQYAEGNTPGMTREPEVPMELLKKARAFTDLAVISICRFSGEGWDRKSDPHSDTISEWEKQLAETSTKFFPNGDFELSPEEWEMVKTVKAHFPKVVVVMNVGGMVDTSWFAADDQIGAVLMAFQGGMEGGLAAAELLLGEGTPSGHLADTFAASLEDYPSTKGFHESTAYVDYKEDIYVGYRYFETIPGARERVNYPFGFGLSYTSFEVSAKAAEKTDSYLNIRASVTNTGHFPGKEVVQVYVEKPQGLLGKPKRELVAFEKTRLLQPGETQQLTLTLSFDRLASYDDLGKVQLSAYVLEKGSYVFYVGTSVRDVKRLDMTYDLSENVIVQQLTRRLFPTSLSERMLSDGSFEVLPMGKANDPHFSALGEPSDELKDANAPAQRARAHHHAWNQVYEGHPLLEVAEGKLTLEEFVAQLSDEELAHLLGGQPNQGVANTYGFGGLPEFGVPAVMTADGPAGLRIAPEVSVCTTAFPCATLLACTWNPELVEAVGAAGGAEVKENNIGVWLTPAINIHRSPLCGRNFEYYSEDPFLTGKLAGAMVRGIQSNNIGASVKHFALNNKETNRKESDSRVSERAAREIYLKAFEMIVKEAEPWTIMSSYNIVNGHRTSENVDLLTGILREEWGFTGMVTTDWWTNGEHYKEVHAGNDLKMACGYPERLLLALEKGVLTRAELETSVKRILNTILKLD